MVWGSSPLPSAGVHMANLNEDLINASEHLNEEKQKEDPKITKLQRLIESGTSYQQIRSALGLSARVVSQLFNQRVSKHNNKKRTSVNKRKKAHKAQKSARKKNR